MAKVMPFRGIRPRKDVASQVAALPYDVLSSDEARALAGNNPLSFLHISKAEIDLGPEVHIYDDTVYEKARENFERFLKEGILEQDPKPCYYVYRQVMPLPGGGQHVQAGLVAGASAEEYQKNIIRKHEETRQDKEDDRTRHVDTLNANTGPVFLTYTARRSIDEIMSVVMENEPENDFISDDGNRHTIWVVFDEPMIRRIREEFEKVEVLYVADGHHRSAAASRVMDRRKKGNPNHTGDEEYNYFLSVIFPHDQMQIMDYNRVVKDLNGLSASVFLQKISEKFEVEERGTEVRRPAARHEFTMYLDGRWYILKARSGTFPGDDPVAGLDVSILQENLLYPVLGIVNPRTDKRIDFVGGIRGPGELKRLVDSDLYKVAFGLYPTSIEDLMKVAEAGKFMPPKSTWFEPKLRSGLVIHRLS